MPDRCAKRSSDTRRCHRSRRCLLLGACACCCGLACQRQLWALLPPLPSTPLQRLLQWHLWHVGQAGPRRASAGDQLLAGRGSRSVGPAAAGRVASGKTAAVDSQSSACLPARPVTPMPRTATGLHAVGPAERRALCTISSACRRRHPVHRPGSRLWRLVRHRGGCVVWVRRGGGRRRDRAPAAGGCRRVPDAGWHSGRCPGSMDGWQPRRSGSRGRGGRCRFCGQLAAGCRLHCTHGGGPAQRCRCCSSRGASSSRRGSGGAA